MPDPLWRPSQEMVASSAMTAYTDWLRAERGLDFGDYHELWQWSVADLEGFWASIWEHFGVVAGEPYEQVLDGRQMPGARWFSGARLNYAENVFAGHRDEEVAIVHGSETRPLQEVTWGELRGEVAAAAAGLRRLGVGPGDRVAAYVPNSAETVIAFLATVSIGAVWSSCSPDFGAGSVADRFTQIEPRVLICADGYSYGGRGFDRREVIADLQSRMPGLGATVLVPFLEDRPDSSPLRGETIGWEELLAPGRGAALEFEQVPFEHPLWILYSSGTTGLPKAIVHSQGGILVEHLKKLHLHTDLRPGDRFMWFTTTGWMMWNFLVSGLLTRAAIVLYDGNPGYPDMSRMWQVCAEAGVTCFGTSAAFIAACMKEGVDPWQGRDLSRLRAIGSTGSPLAPEGFDWVYESVGGDTWLFSTSGGTDMCTAFVGAVPTLPVYRGELQARSLGADVHAFDEGGEEVIGEVGELVVTSPMPSMPICFWGDEDGSRYRESYFEHFPGVWRHGDWIEITERGTAIIYGRSDSTINRGGIRMGTAEIYRAVLAVDEVLDAVVVDVPQDGGGSWMPLFVVLREGTELGEELRSEIARRIRSECSPRHVPDEVMQIAEVPRTLSGKVLEVPVKRILAGEDPEKAVSRGSLQNPEALDTFVELAGSLRGG